MCDARDLFQKCYTVVLYTLYSYIICTETPATSFWFFFSSSFLRRLFLLLYDINPLVGALLEAVVFGRLLKKMEFLMLLQC